MKNFLLLLFALLFFNSCSWPVVTYRWSDWLIKKRIVEVVKFYSPQQDALEVAIDDYLKWHQENMIPKYEKGLLKTKSLVSSSTNSQQIQAQMKVGRALLEETTLALAKKVSPLLAQLNEEQVDRSNTLILRKIDENKERLEWSRNKLKEVTLKKWQDNTVDWLGSINTKQTNILTKGIDSVLYSPKAAYARAINNHKAFIGVFHDIEDLKKREIALNSYFANRYRSDDFKTWRTNAAQLMASLVREASDEQRAHLQKKIDYWLEVLRDIKAL